MKPNGQSMLSYCQDNPEVWGAKAVAICPRPGAPGFPFMVEKGGIDMAERFNTVVLAREPKLRKFQLAANDMLIHTPTGVIARVIRSVGYWRVTIEAWTPPEGEKEAKIWDAKQAEGEWVCWGSCVMQGEQCPSWFPFQEVEMVNARDEDGRFHMDYVEAHHDLNPSMRKANKNHLRPMQKDPSKMTAKEWQRIHEMQRNMIRQLKEGTLEEVSKKLDEPLDSDGDVRFTRLG